MIKSKFLIATIGSLFLVNSVFSIGSPTTSKYTDDDLVWMDDFNGKKIDSNNWSFEFHEPGWVNNELQSYGDSKKNTYVKDGNLIIQPLKSGSNYTSGRINTLGKKEFTYGRFEARLKVPKGKGFLPAFWMMPADESFYGQWPKCGEIDIMEVLGHEISKVHGSLHFGEPHTQKQGTYDLPSGNFSDEFHIFAVEWEPGEMRFYMDDIMYFKENDWFTKKDGFGEVSYPAPYDQPFYIILNVAVGGNWPGNPDASTKFKENAQMVVDYVKVYQKKSYNENVKKPNQVVKVVKPKAGNLARNVGSQWKLHLESDGKAKASLKDNALSVYPEKAGSKDYSVQLIQSNIQLVKGETYKYSFDAYADAKRVIKTGITLPNNSWKRAFGDVRVMLDTSKKRYSYTFVMEESSDSSARIEYDYGNTNSTAAVHISNVRLERVIPTEPVLAHPALPDGNFIYNGEFQEGYGRLEHWEISNPAKAKIFVTNENKIRQLSAVIPAKCPSVESVRVIQNGVKVPAGGQFLVKFKAKSTKPGVIKFRYGTFVASANVTTEMEQYEYNFVAPKSGASGLPFELLLGIPGATVSIDDVVMKENILIQNGNFDKGMRAFEVYAHTAAVEEHDIEQSTKDKYFYITIDNTGNQDWMIQLMQRNVELIQGKTYRLKIKAKCDVDRTIMWALQRDGIKDDNWYPYSGTIKQPITNEFQTFETTFTMDQPTDRKVILSISMGAVNNQQINSRHTVCIDSIVLEEVK